MLNGFGGLGGLNPKKMQEIMKKLGMNQEEISASRVIIEGVEGKNIIIENPSISKISIQGNESFQISGDVFEVDNKKIQEDDIKTIIEKTGVSEKDAKRALQEANGDLVDAIMRLS
ncbi:MAG: nascent polypeptide-associated complex protein [Candidatus Pacearchaeota archaeon]